MTTLESIRHKLAHPEKLIRALEVAMMGWREMADQTISPAWASYAQAKLKEIEDALERG